MDDISAGDIVSCKISDSSIIYNFNKKFDFLESFEIVKVLIPGYLVKVPFRTILTESFKIDNEQLKKYKIHKKFIDIYAHYISDAHIMSIVQKIDGETCDRCNQFSNMAKRDELGNFRCFLCTKYPYR